MKAVLLVLLLCAAAPLLPCSSASAQDWRALSLSNTAKGLVLRAAVPTNGGWIIQQSTNLADWTEFWTNRPGTACLATAKVDQAVGLFRARYIAPPVITVQPTNVLGVWFQRVEFHLECSGEGPFTFRWQKYSTGITWNDVAVKSNAFWEGVSTGGSAMEGTYRCQIVNRGGLVTSQSFTLDMREF